MPDPLGGFAYTWPLYAGAILGYLVGSVPFGLVLTRLFGYGDIRKIGSGNIGATNVLRTGNRWLAAATLLLDGGKGAAAVLLAKLLGPDMTVIVAAAAVLGHLFPVWLRFRGGKGVATTLGVLIAIAWPVGLLACLTWLLVAFAFRYSSLSALVAMAASPVFAWLLGERQIAQLALFLAVLVFIRHAQNIRRLLRGEESRIRLKRSA